MKSSNLIEHLDYDGDKEVTFHVVIKDKVYDVFPYSFGVSKNNISIVLEEVEYER